MWEQDWALLGIEPTTDLAAIKKAYALRLRVTRPDDDAEAYQALRAAYERVQQWVKWQHQEAQEAAAESTAQDLAAPPATQGEAEPLQTVPPEDEGLALIEPRALVAEVDALWRQQGDDALIESWPALRRQLASIALGQGNEVSAVFAHWVLNEPRLPDAFVSALNHHFGWLSDFRTERQIGSDLVAALHAALDGRLIDQAAGPELRRQAAPLLHLYRVLDRWWGIAAPLLAAGIGPGLERLYSSLDAGSRRRLGLRDREQTHLASAFDIAFALRLGLCLLPMAMLGLAKSDSMAKWGWSMAAWLLCGLGGLGFARGAGACFSQGFGFGLIGSRYRAWLQGLRARRWAPWLALALLAAAVWLSAGGYATQHVIASSTPSALTEPVEGIRSITLIDSQALRWAYWIDLLLPMTLGLAGLVIGWPRGSISGQVIAGQILLLTYVVQMGMAGSAGKLWRGLEGPDLIVAIQGGTAITTTWLACWMWLLLGTVVYEQRLPPGLAWLSWLVRPVTNVLTMGDRWGLQVAMAPAMTICGVLWLLDDALSTGTTLLLWAVVVLAVAHVQNGLESRGLSWLERLAMRS